MLPHLVHEFDVGTQSGHSPESPQPTSTQIEQHILILRSFQAFGLIYYFPLLSLVTQAHGLHS